MTTPKSRPLDDSALIARIARERPEQLRNLVKEITIEDRRQEAQV